MNIFRMARVEAAARAAKHGDDALSAVRILRCRDGRYNAWLTNKRLAEAEAEMIGEIRTAIRFARTALASKYGN